MSNPFAFVSLLTSDHYLPGALALAAALRDLHPVPCLPPEVNTFDILCLVTPETLDVKSIRLLRRAFDQVIGVEVIEHPNKDNLHLLGRLDLTHVLTKLHVFRLINYQKIVFLDADVLPLSPLSHLFRLPYSFAAAPDVGWPDIFNSGVFLLEPSESNFNTIMSLVQSKGSWDGGDQGILNEWRGSNWHRLSFTYNTTPTAAYTYAPAYARFGSTIKAIHFIGANKPWYSLPYRGPFSSASIEDMAKKPQAYGYGDLVDRWYAVYDKHYRSKTPPAPESLDQRRYQSAWNAPQSEAPITSRLDLDELRDMATQGLSSMNLKTTEVELVDSSNEVTPVAPHQVSRPPAAATRPVEGIYRSLPLEGRIDLMRPRPPSPLLATPDAEEDDSITPKALSQVQTPIWIPSTDAISSHVSVIPFSPNIHSTKSPLWTATHHEFGAPTNLSTTTSSVPQSSETSITLPIVHYKQQAHLENPPPQQHSPPRPSSPPLIVWNPAVDPPPSEPPPQSAFSPAEHFENVWDRHSNISVPSDPNEASHGFFEVPPQSRIPDKLIREGHYANVIHSTAVRPIPLPDRPVYNILPAPASPVEQPKRSDPNLPDKSKVTVVFPWEAQPRHVPGRAFPRNASPPPEAASRFIKPETTPPQPEPMQLRAPTMSPSSSTSSVTHSGPGSFQNAWDSIPSIQKYATRLQRPASGFSGLTASSSPRGRRSRRGSSGAVYKVWEEHGDSSGLEGDVEDEGADDSDSDVASNRTKRGDLQSRRVSRSYLFQDDRTGKTYRSQGAQTVKIKRRDKSVQSDPAESSTTTTSSASLTSVSSSTGSRISRQVRRGTPPSIAMTAIKLHNLQGGDTLGTPSVDDPPNLLQSAAARRAQVITTLPIVQKAPSPLSQPLRKSLPPAEQQSVHEGSQFPPSRYHRSPDNTISSTDLISPLDTQALPFSPTGRNVLSPLSSARRLVGRSWDPARGVDVFKRESEEVLARFLKMGSWENGPTN